MLLFVDDAYRAETCDAAPVFGILIIPFLYLQAVIQDPREL
jgi:hypothetical protein